MNGTGYTIWKPMIIYRTTKDIKESETAFILFLKAFPELEKEFFLGNEFWIRTSKNHLNFLENLINNRLQITNKNASWKNEYSQEKIEFLLKGSRIVKFEFQGKKHVVNTFGNSDNSFTMDLISLYDMLTECEGGHGLKITPEIL